MTQTPLHRVLDYSRLPLGSIAKVLLLLLSDTAVSLLIPLLIGTVTASILDQATAPSPLNQLLVAWATLICAQAIVRYASTINLGRLGFALSADLRLRMYEHIQALPVDFFQQRTHGDILSLLSQDIQRISAFLSRTAIELVPHLLTLLGAVVIVLSTDFWVGLTALGVLPIILLVTRLLSRQAHPLSKALADQAADHSSITEENLRVQKIIKAFTREPIEIERYRTSNQRLFDSELAHLRITNRVGPIAQAISGLALVALVAIGASRIETGSVNAADFVTVLMYALIMFRPLSALGSSYASYHSAQGAAQRLTTLLDCQQEPLHAGSAVYTAPKQAIRFDQVRFSYPNSRLVFDGLSLSIPAGKTTVIMGKNGIGKTTLAHLLLRFSDPEKGQISFDQTPIDTFPIQQLRQKVAYVPQHGHLINGSILDNIRYGVPDADDITVQRAVKTALLDIFVNQLDDGLNTEIGPNGVRLSGGQQQRIALARALLKPADCFILDEPTAMYDPASEVAQIEALKQRLKGKTVIIITHSQRLQVIADHTITLNPNTHTEG